MQIKTLTKLNLQDYLSYSIPTKEDLIQCKQLIMFHIFRAEIYNDQIFYNDLCYQYFGKGYITNFTVDDIKAGCCVFSYQAFHKTEKMTLCQMMNKYNHPQAIHQHFTCFYFTEFHNEDHTFNNYFFSKLPQL